MTSFQKRQQLNVRCGGQRLWRMRNRSKTGKERPMGNLTFLSGGSFLDAWAMSSYWAVCATLSGWLVWFFRWALWSFSQSDKIGEFLRIHQGFYHKNTLTCPNSLLIDAGVSIAIVKALELKVLQRSKTDDVLHWWCRVTVMVTSIIQSLLVQNTLWIWNN